MAGIGNVLFGDDGFGVAVVERLRPRLPAWAQARAFGVRSLDLAYALMDGPRAAILVDAMPRGAAPGTLYVLDPEIDGPREAITTHGLDPARVLRMVRSMTGTMPAVRIVGCEPGRADEMTMSLSLEVEAAVEPACRMIEALLSELEAPCTR